MGGPGSLLIRRWARSGVRLAGFAYRFTSWFGGLASISACLSAGKIGGPGLLILRAGAFIGFLALLQRTCLLQKSAGWGAFPPLLVG